MADYIERERLKEAFNADLQTLQSLDKHTMNLILAEIEEAPAADVEPVVLARWKFFNKQNKAVCTNCSWERNLDWNLGRAVACPNCGATMDT